jgi:hypothetical protein
MFANGCGIRKVSKQAALVATPLLLEGQKVCFMAGLEHGIARVHVAVDSLLIAGRGDDSASKMRNNSPQLPWCSFPLISTAFWRIWFLALSH